MNATLLCVALLVPGHGEKDIRKALEDAGVCVHQFLQVGLTLDFDRVKGTDALLSELCELRGIWALLLRGSDVTDAGMATVGGLKKLEGLNLESTSVTDAGLRHLERLPALHGLSLCGTAVTDEGLRHFESMSNLGDFLMEPAAARAESGRSCSGVSWSNCHQERPLARAPLAFHEGLVFFRPPVRNLRRFQYNRLQVQQGPGSSSGAGSVASAPH